MVSDDALVPSVVEAEGLVTVVEGDGRVPSVVEAEGLVTVVEDDGRVPSVVDDDGLVPAVVEDEGRVPSDDGLVTWVEVFSAGMQSYWGHGVVKHCLGEGTQISSSSQGLQGF